MALHTYDPKEVLVIIGGAPIGGFADGTAIKVNRASDAYSKVVGADGIVSRARSNDTSGEVSITLAQTSPSNDILSAIAAVDEASNAGVIPILIQDTLGRSTFVSAFGWIRKQADAEFAKEITNREWVLDAADITMFVGGNTTEEPA